MNTVKAVAKGVRMSRRKVNLVAGLVRGRSVSDALVILSNTPKRAAEPIAKVISSAAANATNNNKMISKSLIVSEIVVSQGTTMKRFRPAAMGRALPFRRPTCHINVVVTGETRTEKPAAEAKKSTAKPASTKKKVEEK
jgi:large subunit ribosomal protein L22